MSEGSPTHKIFALRRAKRIDEAYETCKKHYPDFSKLKDKWEVAAVGWTLIDMIKASRESGETERLLDELQCLSIYHDDLLDKHVRRLLNRHERERNTKSFFRPRAEETDATFEAAWEKSPTADDADRLARGCHVRIERELDSKEPNLERVSELFDRYASLPMDSVSDKTRGQLQEVAYRRSQLTEPPFSFADYLLKTGGLIATVDKTVVDEWLDVERYMLVETRFANAVIRELLARAQAGEVFTAELKAFIADDLIPSVSLLHYVRQSTLKTDIDAMRVGLHAGAFGKTFEYACEAAEDEHYEFEAACIAAECLMLGSPEDAAAVYAYAIGTRAPGTGADKAAERLFEALRKAGRTDDVGIAARYIDDLYDASGKKTPKLIAEAAQAAAHGGSGVFNRLFDRGEGLMRTDAEEVDGNVGHVIGIRRSQSAPPERLLAVWIGLCGIGPGVVCLKESVVQEHGFRPGDPVTVKGWIDDETGEYKLVHISRREDGSPWDRVAASDKASAEIIGFENEFAVARLAKKKTVKLSPSLITSCRLTLKKGDRVRVKFAAKIGYPHKGELIAFDAALEEEKKAEGQLA